MEIRIKEIVAKLHYEYVLIEVKTSCNLGDYILFDTPYAKDGTVSNEVRHSFIFPNSKVKKGDLVFLYSGKGQQQSSSHGMITAHKFYWGLDEHVWNNDGDCALLVKIMKSESFTVTRKVE
ncbi:MAG: hypothetical protein EOP04_10080 [Proteobacteria bacterium]|nr:MAG: hypothetical protein EOP04_10080 [Pseudomonadota bacterium]